MSYRTVLVGLALLVCSWPAQADIVTDWNDQLLDSVRAERTNPPRATRQMAILHVSIYDAVNAIVGGFEPYAIAPVAGSPASPEAAAAAAGHTALVALYPARATIFDDAYNAMLAAIPDGNAKSNGIALGEMVAEAILDLRANDGSANPVPFTGPDGAGWWLPTPPGFAPPLLPQWPTVTPWAMAKGSQFRLPAPPALYSDEYTYAYLEVFRLGRATSPFRTADQTEIARFWDDGAGTQTPPGHWMEIAQTVSAAQGNTLAQNARLFALLGVTVADAAIVAWDTKYTWGHWRPVTGIRAANSDANPLTFEDPSWSSLLTTPPFPAYTSGHSTFSGSSSRLLALFYGTDDIGFSATADPLPGVTRSFTSLSQAAEEAGQSRIYGGIHWQYDNTGGLSSGRRLAELVFFNQLRPVVAPSTCSADSTSLCLGSGGRFEVRASWRTADGSGVGNAQLLTLDSGFFSFFDPNNAEIAVKVIDGCDLSGTFWVFASGLTDVEVQLTVTDTQTGKQRNYFNPLGQTFAPVQDTAAFQTCP